MVLMSKNLQNVFVSWLHQERNWISKVDTFGFQQVTDGVDGRVQVGENGPDVH